MKNSNLSNMPSLPPKDSIIRRKPSWKPPKPGEGTRGYPSIEVSTPTITIESSGNKKRSKTNTGSRRSLKTDMSSLSRKNMSRRQTVKAKPAGSNPQGTRVVARAISASLRKRNKRKSKKRRYKKKKSKKYTKKRNKK